MYIVPEGGLLLEDPTAEYKKTIEVLKKRLEKANRGKKYIISNLTGA